MFNTVWDFYPCLDLETSNVSKQCADSVTRDARRRERYRSPVTKSNLFSSPWQLIQRIDFLSLPSMVMEPVIAPKRWVFLHLWRCKSPKLSLILIKICHYFTKLCRKFLHNSSNSKIKPQCLLSDEIVRPSWKKIVIFVHNYVYAIKKKDISSP